MCFQGQRQMDSESEQPWHKSAEWTLISQKTFQTTLTRVELPTNSPKTSESKDDLHMKPFAVDLQTHPHTHTHKSHGSQGPFEDVNRNQASWTWNLYILYHMVEVLLKWWSPNDPQAIFVLNHRNQKCWNSQKLKVWSLRVPPGSFRRLPCQSITASFDLSQKI